MSKIYFIEIISYEKYNYVNYRIAVKKVLLIRNVYSM